MITTGIIERVEKTKNNNANCYKVRMPVFHGMAGSGSNVTTDQLPVGYYCPLPHMELTKLNVGDAVYVALVNLSIDEVLILGFIPKIDQVTKGVAPNKKKGNVAIELTGSSDTATNLSVTQILELGFTNNADVKLPKSAKYYIDSTKYLTSSDLYNLSDTESPVLTLLNNIYSSVIKLLSKLITKNYHLDVIKGSAGTLSITQETFEKAIGLSSNECLVILLGKKVNNNLVWIVRNGSIESPTVFNSLRELGIECSGSVEYPCTIKVTILEEVNTAVIDPEGAGKRDTVTTGSVIPYAGGNNVIVGHACSSKDNASAGDQAQKGTPDGLGEVRMDKYDDSGRWMKVFRCTDRRKRLIMANRCIYACNNSKIGYSFGSASLSVKLFINNLYNKNFTLQCAFRDVTYCNTDCSNFIGNLVYSVGCGLSESPSTEERRTTYQKLVGSYTGNQEANYLSTGEFRVFEASTANNPLALKIGDILWRRSDDSGHTAMVVEVPANQDCWELDDGTSFDPSLGEAQIGFNSKVVTAQSSTEQFEEACNINILLAESEYTNAIPSECKLLIIVKANFKEANMKKNGSSNNTTCEVRSFERIGSSSNKVEWKNSSISLAKGFIGSAGTIIANSKREGDKKTPKGLFKINAMFGSLPTSTYCNNMNYFQINSDTVWIDDLNAGQYYNSRMKKSEMSERGLSGKSYEAMSPLLAKGYYNYGLVINWNNPKAGFEDDPTESAFPGNGSAIFMHSGDVVTSGCVAVPSETMAQYLEWLDSNKKPYILIY